jgi:membrane protein DedA with SNARE-associated domain
LNLIGAVLWALVIGFLGYLCGHVLELILGEIKQLEGPILVGIAVIGGLWFFFNRFRRDKAPAIVNS